MGQFEPAKEGRVCQLGSIQKNSFIRKDRLRQLTIVSIQDIFGAVIQNFRHKGLKRLFEKDEPQGIRGDQVQKVQNILAVLNRARAAEDMGLPGFRLHPLKGDRKGFWSVTVRANWRVTFRFEGGHAYDVD